jgi:hypothetical protein
MMDEDIKFETVPILDNWQLLGTGIGMSKWVSKEEFEAMFQTEPKPISTEAKSTQKLKGSLVRGTN